MNWIKDIFKAILKRTLIYLLLFIQLFISLINAYLGVERWQSSKLDNNKINNFKNIKNVYGVRVNFPEDSFKKSIRFDISKELEEKSKYKIIGFTNENLSANQEMTYIVANHNLLDIFKLNVIVGTANFEEGKNQALAGYNLRDKYKLGDKVYCSELGEDIEIIGFLEENHPSFNEFSENLNIKLIIIDDNIEKTNTRCLVYSEEGYNKTKKELAKILELNGSIDFIDMEEKFIDSRDMSLKEAKNLSFYSIGMFIFSLSVFISLLILIINDTKRDIGIKIACGAKRISIYGFMLGQLLVIYILAALTTLGTVYIISTGSSASKTFLQQLSLEYILLMNGSAILLVILVSIPIFVKIITLKPVDLIRNE